MLTDPIADMLTRIRNANKAMLDTAETDEQAFALLRALGLPFATERRER